MKPSIKKANSDKWTQFNHEILANLDIVEEYKALGLDVIGTPDGNDWVQCRAFGRDDKNPSAQINVSRTVSRGQYTDFTSEKRTTSFFDFAAIIAGRYPTWFEARDDYAKKLGIKPPKAKSPNESAHLVEYNRAIACTWFPTKPPVNESAFLAAGGALVNHNGDVRIALPIYGVMATVDHPIGYVVWHTMGIDLELRIGKKITKSKMLTVGGSEAGLIGKFGLEHLNDAEIVWKTEGPTDLLGLMSMIPKELRKKHVVLTNSAGTTETPSQWQIDRFEGKTVYVVHDADTPGQTGAMKWASAIATVAKEVRIVRLPYEISENHGKDLRDFFDEKKSYDDLLKLAETASVVEKPKEPIKTSADEICEKLNLDVLGNEDGKIKFYSRERKYISTLPKSLKGYSYCELIRDAGEIIDKMVSPGDVEVEGKFNFNDVIKAIAAKGGRQRLTNETTRGQGVWMAKNGNLVLVGYGEAAIWDGNELTLLESPMYEDLILDFASGPTFYHFEELKKALENEEADFSRKTFLELSEIFGRWLYRDDQNTMPFLLSGLVLASFVQTTLRWRPQISITGESGSGKTTFFSHLKEIFGNLHVFADNISEAGIRAMIRNKACVPILDEFEQTPYREQILAFLRVAGAGGKQVRSSQEQKSIEFTIRHIFWLAGIELNLKREPDINRFIQIELKCPTSEDFLTRGKIYSPRPDSFQDLSNRLLAMALKNLSEVLETVHLLKEHDFSPAPTRIVENYSVAAAFAACVMELDPVQIMQQFLATYRMEELISDQDNLLTEILNIKLRTDENDVRTIGYMLQHQDAELNYNRELETNGIVVRTGFAKQSIRNDLKSKFQNGFFLVPPMIEQLLVGTKWEKQSVSQILKRTKDACISTISINGRRQRAIWINYDVSAICNEEKDKDDVF